MHYLQCSLRVNLHNIHSIVSVHTISSLLTQYTIVNNLLHAEFAAVVTRQKTSRIRRTFHRVTKAAFEKSCRLIRLIWSPLLPFDYSIISIRSIWMCVRLLHRDYSEHDLNARSPDYERSDHSVVQIKDGGRKWLFHLPMKQRVSSAGDEM